jgi:hypothetical protein
MKTAKYRNVGTKHILIMEDGTRKQYEDLHMLIRDCRQQKITITNPVQLPPYFQEKLNN